MAAGPIAQVIVNLSLDRPFDYAVPAALAPRVHLGSKVAVPLGESRREGYVIGFAQNSPHRLRPLLEVIGERALITPKLLALAEWLADYYCCPHEWAVQTLLPAVVRKGQVKPRQRKFVTWAADAHPGDALAQVPEHHVAQRRALQTMARLQRCSLAFLSKQGGGNAGAVEALVKQGWLQLEEAVEERDPFAGQTILPDEPLPLTAEQADALTAIEESCAADKRGVILLHGVTGSGKTEVYLQAIAGCLERGEEAIVLVPEICLTPQTTERFRSRFGDRVSVLHSHLGDGERFEQWSKINEGRVQIVVGARSAVFAPFRNLGLIVVDEEHENTYKQDRPPRYHARDVAVMRGHLENCTVVLGTATPALESYCNVERGKYRLCTLPRRADESTAMPTIEVVDMAAEGEGKGGFLSARLRSAIGQALAECEQVIIFHNRRGYATNLRCPDCEYVAACPDCAVNFTYHRGRELLLCHLCGQVRRPPPHCPDCGSTKLTFRGLGTEKAERILGGAFPGARILRMDADTMTRKDAYREALTAFRAGAVDILVGTQMIAKGLHFPNVTLVGILQGDKSLNLPDFRAGERTYQLIVQVAGRAGRGELPGRVIVQTWTPYHYAVEAAVRGDYAAFYQEEITERRTLELPPVTRLAQILAQGEDEATTEQALQAFCATIADHLPDHTTLVPVIPAPIPRKRTLFQFVAQLYTPAMMTCARLLKRALQQFRAPRGVRLSVDVDPTSIL